MHHDKKKGVHVLMVWGYHCGKSEGVTCSYCAYAFKNLYHLFPSSNVIKACAYASGSQMVNDLVHPVHPQGRPAIESRRQAERLESDDDD